MRTRVVLAFLPLTAWSVAYVIRLRRDMATWWTVTDAAALLGMATATHWLTPDDWLLSGKSWLRPFLTFACVGYQYYTPARLGVPVAAAIAAAAGLATNSAAPVTLDTVVTACWFFAIAMLARLIWSLLNRGGRAADTLMLRTESVRREQEIAAGVRADARAITNALHDTSATTLLMVGMGQGALRDDLLARRARRDLAVLRQVHSDAAVHSDFSELVRRAVDLVPLQVHVVGPVRVSLPTEVARALADATGEALVNAARHAQVTDAQVEMDDGNDVFTVTIRDAGRGFSPQSVASTRRGLRESIVNRMSAVGGGAVIVSSPGHGTAVELRWPS